MKTKNVKVRLKDIKHGLIMYVAHPEYDIEKYTIQGKPFTSKYPNSLFVNVLYETISGGHKMEISLCDAGIIPPLYNGRRAFVKLKHAHCWVEKWSKDKEQIERQKAHDIACDYMGDLNYADLYD